MTDIAIEVNCETGEVTERPLTSQELTERDLAAYEAAVRKQEEEAEAEAKAEAKAALLSKLGITAEEAELLLK